MKSETQEYAEMNFKYSKDEQRNNKYDHYPM